MKSMRLKIQNSYGNLKKVIRPKFQSLAFLLVKYIYFFIRTLEMLTIH